MNMNQAQDQPIYSRVSSLVILLTNHLFIQAEVIFSALEVLIEEKVLV